MSQSFKDLAQKSLDELVELGGVGAQPNSQISHSVKFEIERRVVIAQMKAAEATVEATSYARMAADAAIETAEHARRAADATVDTAEHARRNADYMLWSVIALVAAAAVGIVTQVLFR